MVSRFLRGSFVHLYGGYEWFFERFLDWMLIHFHVGVCTAYSGLYICSYWLESEHWVLLFHWNTKIRLKIKESKFQNLFKWWISHLWWGCRNCHFRPLIDTFWQFLETATAICLWLSLRIYGMFSSFLSSSHLKNLL